MRENGGKGTALFITAFKRDQFLLTTSFRRSNNDFSFAFLSCFFWSSFSAVRIENIKKVTLLEILFFLFLLFLFIYVLFWLLFNYEKKNTFHISIETPTFLLITISYVRKCFSF